jgi:hypothetical protein
MGRFCSANTVGVFRSGNAKPGNMDHLLFREEAVTPAIFARYLGYFEEYGNNSDFSVKSDVSNSW